MCALSIAIALISTPVIISTLVPNIEAAVPVTARTLRRAALLSWPEGAWQLITGIFGPLRPAALFYAVFFPTTVTFFTIFYNTISTYGDLRF